MQDLSTAYGLQSELDRLGSYAAISREHGVSVTTLKDRGKRLGCKSPNPRAASSTGTTAQSATRGPTTPSASIAGDAASITLPAGMPWTIESVCESVNLDPAEWIAVEARPNIWQGLAPKGVKVDLHQLTIRLQRRIPKDMWLPARTDAPIRKHRPARKPSTTRPILIALAADQHCPHQDPDLESCWLQWLETNKPDKIIGMGDLINLSKPSRHRANLHQRHNDEPAECFQTGHDWWRRSLDAAGDQCEGQQIAGNHDLRAQIACMERLPELYDVKRPGEEHPWWDLEYLLGLDKLGVLYHRPSGEYHSVELPIARGFSGAHGAKSGPYGGAPKDAPRHEGSRATAHAHKASITNVVRYRDGEAHTHVNVSVPTMARLDMGYHPDPDTHQGWATLVVHEDGYWNPELARFDSRRGKLVWRDQQYRP